MDRQARMREGPMPGIQDGLGEWLWCGWANGTAGTRQARSGRACPRSPFSLTPSTSHLRRWEGWAMANDEARWKARRSRCHPCVGSGGVKATLVRPDETNDNGTMLASVTDETIEIDDVTVLRSLFLLQTLAIDGWWDAGSRWNWQTAPAASCDHGIGGNAPARSGLSL